MGTLVLLILHSSRSNGILPRLPTMRKPETTYCWTILNPFSVKQKKNAEIYKLFSLANFFLVERPSQSAPLLLLQSSLANKPTNGISLFLCCSRPPLACWTAAWCPRGRLREPGASGTWTTTRQEAAAAPPRVQRDAPRWRWAAPAEEAPAATVTYTNHETFPPHLTCKYRARTVRAGLCRAGYLCSVYIASLMMYFPLLRTRTDWCLRGHQYKNEGKCENTKIKHSLYWSLQGLECELRAPAMFGTWSARQILFQAWNLKLPKR